MQLLKTPSSSNGVTGSLTGSPATYQAAAPLGSWDLANTFPGAGYYTGTTNTPAQGDIRRGQCSDILALPLPAVMKHS